MSTDIDVVVTPTVVDVVGNPTVTTVEITPPAPAVGVVEQAVTVVDITAGPGGGGLAPAQLLTEPRFQTNQRYLQGAAPYGDRVVSEPNTLGLSKFIGAALGGTMETAVIVGDSYIELNALAPLYNRFYAIFGVSSQQNAWKPVRSVFGTTWNSAQGTASTHGLNGYSNIMTNGQVCSITLSCDAFDIYYCTGAGSIEVRIDGVLATTIDTTTGFRWQSAALTYASHVVTITSVGNTEPYAGMFYSGGRTRPEFHGRGHSGWSANAMQDVAQYNDGTIRHITNVKPMLIFYQLHLNDYVGFTPAQSEANWRTTIQACKAASPKATVVVIGSPGAGNRTNWNLYRDALLKVAQEERCMFVDTFEALGTFGGDGTPGNPLDPYGFTADGLHLSAMGQQIYSAKVWDAVFGPLSGFPNTTNNVLWTFPGLTVQSLLQPTGEIIWVGPAFLPIRHKNVAPGVVGVPLDNANMQNLADASDAQALYDDNKSTFVASTVANPSSGTTATVTVPTGTVDGDLLVAVITTSGTEQPSLPAGWTSLFASAVNPATLVMWRRASAEPASYASTWTTSVSSSNVCLTYRTAGNPVGFVSSEAFSGATLTYPAGVAATTGRWVAMGLARIAGSFLTAPANSNTRVLTSGSTVRPIQVSDRVAFGGAPPETTATLSATPVATRSFRFCIPVP